MEDQSFSIHYEVTLLSSKRVKLASPAKEFYVRNDENDYDFILKHAVYVDADGDYFLLTPHPLSTEKIL